MFSRTLSIASLTLLSTATFACPFCHKPTTGLFIGESRLMGNGTIRSWIDVAEDGTPKTIGAAFNSLALTGLPAGTTNEMSAAFFLGLPEVAKKTTPFDHLEVNWNPKGHEPKGIYDKPHFDFHFYTVPTTVRSQITLQGESKKLCVKAPAKGFMPTGYMMAPGTEMPYMGVHWADLSSPEFAGKPFTASLIYGSYDGALAFVEPMVAMSFLESKPDYVAAIPLPAIVKRSGFYPTEYRVRYDADRDEYSVVLEKFVRKVAVNPALALK